jgi:hypothetical protein
MRSCFACADNPPYFFTYPGVKPWCCMHHKNDNATNNADSLPTFLIQIHITATGCHWIVEHKYSSFKAQTMLPLVDGILFGIPYPSQIDSLRSNVVTF